LTLKSKPTACILRKKELPHEPVLKLTIMIKKITTLSAVFALSFSAFAQNNDLSKVSGWNQNAEGNVSFKENKGQIVDQNFQPRQDVLFSGTDGQLAYHLKNTGISYQLSRVDSWKDMVDSELGSPEMNLPKVPDQTTIYRVDVNWLNANDEATIRKGEALVGFDNYYTAACSNGANQVKTYSDISYLNLYSGITLKWYSKENHLKYDYIVSAGSNYKQIKLQYEGAESLSLNEKGELIIKTPLGQLIEQAPLVFQAGKILRSKWVINDQTVSFDIEDIDPTKAFTIDPGIRIWGTYYGDTGGDNGYSCTTDGSGNIYLAGNAGSSAGIATVGLHQTVFGGVTDAFLAKFDANGVRLWGTYYGGASNDLAWSCHIDGSGNIYLSGTTRSTTGIATPGAHRTTLSGTLYDAFLVKFDVNGARIWGTYYGGTGNEVGYSCKTNASGDVYLAGYTASTSNISTAGAHQTAFGGIVDGFLAKFNSSGVRQWGTYYGGTNTDEIRACSIDASGDIYVVGRTASGTGISTAGSHQVTFGGTNDVLFAKFNSAGARQWGMYYGGVGSELGFACTVDPSGNIYIAGQAASSSAIATVGAHQTAYAGLNDGFIAKFNNSGVRSWGTYYGSGGTDIAYACTTDPSGNVYLAGETSSSTAISTADAHQTIYAGGTDAFLVKFSSTGTRDWATYYGTNVGDYAYSCVSQGVDNVCLAGYTSSTTAIATPGSHQSALGGGTDAFLVKFVDCPTIIVSVITQTDVSCNGATDGSVTISATGGAGFTYNWTPSGGTGVTASGLAAGTYTCTVTNSCGATATQTVTITEPLVLVVTASANPTTICNGSSSLLTASGVNTYNWMPGNLNGASVSDSPTVTTTYTVTGTAAPGCSATATVLVTVNPSPTVTATASSSTICNGSFTTLSATGASTYNWMPGNVSGSPVAFAPSSTTTYTVTGTAANGCTATATQLITVNICSGPTTTVPCGLTFTKKTSTVSAVNVVGAVNYRFRFYDNVTNVQVAQRIQSSRTLTLVNASGLYYNTTYKWTVAVDVGSGFGPESPLACTITLGPAQTTVPCGSTYTNLAAYTTVPHAGAITNYRFTFYDNVTNAIIAQRTQPSNYIYFNTVPALTYGTTYKWSVAVEYPLSPSGTAFGPESNINCTLTFAAPQTTVPCNGTYNRSTGYSVAPSVSGATGYRFSFYQGVTLVGQRTQTSNLIYFNTVPGISNGNSYTWTVEVQYNGPSGLTFGTPSTPCPITFSSSAIAPPGNSDNPMGREGNSDLPMEENISVYPNPTQGLVYINSNEAIEAIYVYSVAGELLFTETQTNQFSLEQFATGTYFIVVKTESGLKRSTVIKE
jgi:Secretion system C-terminal sorting domain